MIHDCIIIGSGPAAYTAAIYLGRSEIKPILFMGPQPGGQLVTTTGVENYPGFPDGISGFELMQNMKKQAEKFGAEIIQKKVDKVDFKDFPHKLIVGDDEYLAKTVIISTGASARWLGLDTEKRFRGRGVSSCATCDGAFFKDKIVAVVGGGDTSMEEAGFLTQLASKVYLIARKPKEKLRASKIEVEKTLSNPKIEFLGNTIVTEVLGDKFVTGIKIRNNETDQESEIKTNALFVAIGHKPNTEIFEGQIDLDHETKYIITKSKTHTSRPGVFAAGDVTDPRYRQAIVAAGSGCMAAIDSIHHLKDLKTADNELK